MSETSWGESDATPPPAKKRIPTWLWFCGGGCLLAVVVGIVVIAWFATMIQKAGDPEQQWPEVSKVLPYDERPPELELKFGMEHSMVIPMDHVFVFKDTRGFIAFLMRFREVDAASVREKYLNPEFSGSFMGIGGRKGLSGSTVSVQGRDLKVLRFFQERGSKDGGAAESEPSGGGMPGTGKGPAAVIDLTPEGDAQPLVLQMVRFSGGDEPVSDDDIRAFLKNFHVGNHR